MDPTQALIDALTALLSADVPGARESLHHYREWRDRGGFEPVWNTPSETPSHSINGDALYRVFLSAIARVEEK